MDWKPRIGRGIFYSVAFWGLFMLTACTSQAPLPPQPTPEEETGLVYIVKPGDALSVIALQHGESYRNLARWNNLEPPYVIHPGQRLRLTPPSGGAMISENSASEKSPRPGTKLKDYPEKLQSAPQKSSRTADNINNTEEEPAEKINWQWPVPGRIRRGFSSRNQGINLGGQKGDPVYAAAAGKVVYSGTGILGYGPLIIIKHNNTYLSAYAHNKQLLVKEGDQVAPGQQIAEMGSNQHQDSVLHFEIRRNGKSVDPTEYLPQR